MILNSWYTVGFAENFAPDSFTGQTLVQRPILIWRNKAGEFSAYDGRCPHKRFPLWEGNMLEDEVLECKYHGWCFNHDGECVDIPPRTKGKKEGLSKADLSRIPIQEKQGCVWVFLGDPADADKFGVPDTPEITSSEYYSVSSEDYLVPASYILSVENLLDITHLYPLHASSIGNRENSEVPVHFEQYVKDRIPIVKCTREVANYPLPPQTSKWFGYEVIDRISTHELNGPSVMRIQYRAAPPGELGDDSERGYIIYHFFAPVDEKTHLYRWYLSSRAHLTAPHDPDLPFSDYMASTLPPIIAEDLWVLTEQQKMFEFPDNGYREVNIKSDGGVAMGRKMLDALERGDFAAVGLEA